MIITVMNLENKKNDLDDLVRYLGRILSIEYNKKVLLIDNTLHLNLFKNFNINDINPYKKNEINNLLSIISFKKYNNILDIKTIEKKYDIIIIYNELLNLKETIFKISDVILYLKSEKDKFSNIYKKKILFLDKKYVNNNLKSNKLYTIFDVISENNLYKKQVRELINVILENYYINCNNIIYVDFKKKYISKYNQIKLKNI